MTEKKNPAAVALGKLGGKAGRGASQRRTPEHYRAIQKKSVAARKVRSQSPTAPSAIPTAAADPPHTASTARVHGSGSPRGADGAP